MGRHLGSKHRICRRVGEAICGSLKCPVHKKAYPPGEHGGRRRQRKLSEFGVMMIEKQKLRFMYGLLEKQFRRYFQKAAKMPGKTGDNLLMLIETRLDNLVFRAGFAPTVVAARQMVRHGHFTVGKRKMDIPSYQVKPNQVVQLKDKSRSKPVYKDYIEEAKDKLPVQPYMKTNFDNLEFQVTHLPAREEIPVSIKEQLIVEYYSK